MTKARRFSPCSHAAGWLRSHSDVCLCIQAWTDSSSPTCNAGQVLPLLSHLQVHQQVLALVLHSQQNQQ